MMQRNNGIEGNAQGPAADFKQSYRGDSLCAYVAKRTLPPA
ncbi:hypothetical protein CBM2610_A120311 [Cupriavidus taiwanensis]|nr:hypothetical protein CBM2610_A120311 [Cupriavidus taiwanensis]